MQFRFTFIKILIILLALLRFLCADDSDYIYFKNFVKHSDGTSCKEVPPEATFTVMINSDSTHILTDLAPRWDKNADPNIDGKGTFGIELGNFDQPEFKIGDTLQIRFTCSKCNEQGKLTDICPAIPWYRFPQTLILNQIVLPQRPQPQSLTKDEQNGWRTLHWNGNPYDDFLIYRRSYSDTIAGDQVSMQYMLISRVMNSLSFIDSTADKNEKYGYLIYAVDNAGNISARSEEINEDPYVLPGLDLTISYIARLPRIDYVWNSNNPAIEGWPPPEEPVTWKAVIKNWGDTLLPDVDYKWYLDGDLADSGQITIAAADTVSINFQWPWTFERHILKFEIDTDNSVAEEEEGNNQLTIYTDAISAGFYVEKSVYDYFHKYQKELKVHSNCWEDWAQRHVKIWNDMFANAIFELTPHGVLDRIRIDKITVVPDGALPLNGGLPTNNPNLNDRTVDLQWGFPKTLIEGDFYADHQNVSKNNPFYFEGSLLHELGHARYLIDVYGFNLHDDGNGNSVAIKENGKLIVGTDYMPLYGDRVFFAPYTGLMSSDYNKIDEYSAAALNLIAGHRAISGNYNAPGNIGVFLQDLPQNNYLHITDQYNSSLSQADVFIYRAEKQDGVWYGKYYDDEADLQLTADNNGVVSLGRCPFDDDGTVDHTYGLANGVLIIRAQHEGRIGYGFLDVTQFNMEYWRGHNLEGHYELQIEMQTPAGIKSKSLPNKNRGYLLYPNYPNPFNAQTTIRVEAFEAGDVDLSVFNCAGEKIKTLYSGNLSVGLHTWQWYGENESEHVVSSGIYYIRISAGARHFIKRMLLIK